MITRFGQQEYATPAALIAETLIPENNHSVYIESLRRPFNFIQGSAVAPDGTYVIDQTSATALGRWMSSSVVDVFTGTGNTDALANSQQSVLTITATGAEVAKANLVAITNADTFPVGVILLEKQVVANDTVRVTVENQTGGSIASFAVNVSVLEF